MRGARCDRSGRKSGEGSAGPEPKIATVERREASVPRTRGRKAPHKRLACSVEHAQRVLRTSTRTSLGAPPTPHSG